MRTLSHWKGLRVTLTKTLSHCKNREMRREYTRALLYATKKIQQIEDIVLIKKALLIAMLFVAGFVHGCATMSGIGEDIQAVSEGYRGQQGVK